MKTSDLEFDLPEDLIAQVPAEPRDASRLLVVDRQRKTFHEHTFRELPARLAPGDCLVLNDTRVIPARLTGTKQTGGRIEALLLRQLEPGLWEALLRPSGRVKSGVRVSFGESLTAVAGDRVSDRTRRLRFEVADVLTHLENSGLTPLPPYIRRSEIDPRDRDRYQTIYAKSQGAVAAPTAGLHFTEAVFSALNRRGIDHVTLTLHVGYGTFKPIESVRLEDHRVDPEVFDLPLATARRLNNARAGGRRVIAVGTTVTRVLETRYRDGVYVAGTGETDRYIFPPHQFRALDALLTNFHLPCSSLLALTCAFGGTELILEAYRYAVSRKFRFYSYGDAMLIL